MPNSTSFAVPAGVVEPTPDLKRGRAFARAAALLLCSAIAMSETDRLITGAVNNAGLSHSITEIVGVRAMSTGQTAWSDWAGLPMDSLHRVCLWIALHALFDIGLYVGYLRILSLFVGHAVAHDPSTPNPKPENRRQRFFRWIAGPPGLAGTFLRMLFMLEVVETVLLWIGAALLWSQHHPRGFVWLALGVTAAKWVVAVGAVLVTVVRYRTFVRAGLGRVFRALLVQRLSFAVVILVAVLSVIPGRNIWDQLPDVQRSWFVWDDVPLLHFIWAFVAAVVVGLYLFVLGRQRTERIWSTYVLNRTAEADPEPSKGIWFGWIVAALLPFGAAIVLSWLSDEPAVDWSLVLAATVAPLLVLLLTQVVCCVAPKEGSWWDPSKRVPRPTTYARDVWVAGDVLAVSLVLLAGLGLIRSLIAPILLGPEGHPWVWSLRLVATVVGVALAFGAFPALACVAAKLKARKSNWFHKLVDPTTQADPSPTAYIPLTAAVLWLVCLIAFPLNLAPFAGVVATVLLTLGSWAFILGFVIVRLQRYRPLPVFRALRLRATPLLSLLLVFVLFQARSGGDPALHRLRPDATAANLSAVRRVSLEDAFDTWSKNACVQKLGGQSVQPMVLVAASGGGVRAMAWTAGVLDKLRTGRSCSPVFLSSGVSGGSIGLALSRGGNAMGDAETIAGESALSSAVAGLFVGDLVASATGVRPLSYARSTPQPWSWRDRAGLMETYWEKHVDALKESYGSATSGTGGVLVLNSVAAASGCRVLVSQVDLRTGSSPDEASANCGGRIDEPPASLDLEDLYGACQHQFTWATAAMLSARFPTVTPAGRVGSCSTHEDLQLIDGGYAEPSGLGTLSDIAPGLLRIVERHNEKAPAKGPYVVPIVLFLEDEARTDIVRPPRGLSTEAFVPLAGLNAKAVQTSSGTWLQRLSTAIADPCAQADAGKNCRAAVGAVREHMPNGVVVVTPATKPSVEAPLGWTLSPDSINQLQNAINDQASGCRSDLPGKYACLSRLLEVLKPAS